MRNGARLGWLLDPLAKPLKCAPGRLAYLFLAPPISAWCAFVLARAFVGRDRTRISHRLHAICAFCCAFLLAIVRFRLSQF